MSEQVGVYLSNNLGQIFVLHLLHTPYRKWTVPTIERLSTDLIEDCALRALWKYRIYEINLSDLIYLGIDRTRHNRSILHGFLVKNAQFDCDKVCRASIGTVLAEVTPSNFDGVTSASTVPMDALKVCSNDIDLCQWSPFERTAGLIPSWQRGHLRSIEMMK